MTENGSIVHYQKAKATILSQASNMLQIAHFLLIVMSLQRTIVMNSKKLIVIYKVELQDSVRYLAIASFDSVNNNTFYRTDSPVPSSKSDNGVVNSDLGDVEENLMEINQSRRVLELINDKIREIKHANDISTCAN